MPLNLKPNIKDPDGFYQQLMDLQKKHSEEELQSINATLILLLANHIGDREVLDQAMEIALSRP